MVRTLRSAVRELSSALGSAAPESAVAVAAERMHVPYAVMYLGTSVIERLFGLLGKPEPLNRRRLISLMKDRLVDSSKFRNTFQFQFQESVEGFIANELP